MNSINQHWPNHAKSISFVVCIKQNCDWTGKQLNANFQHVQTIHPIQKDLKPATLQKTSIYQKQKQEKLIHLTAITYYIFQIQKGYIDSHFEPGLFPQTR